MCKIVYQKAASETAGIEVEMETRDAKKDMNDCPVGKYGSKATQKRSGQKKSKEQIWDDNHLT